MAEGTALTMDPNHAVVGVGNIGNYFLYHINFYLQSHNNRKRLKYSLPLHHSASTITAGAEKEEKGRMLQRKKKKCEKNTFQKLCFLEYIF